MRYLRNGINPDLFHGVYLKLFGCYIVVHNKWLGTDTLVEGDTESYQPQMWLI